MSLWEMIKQWCTLDKTNAEWDTAGPAPQLSSTDVGPPPKILDIVNANAGNSAAAPAWLPSPVWKDGWWSHAVSKPAHPGRIGPSIVPRAIVVHTTDTMPGGFQAIIKSWMGSKGFGNAAHFLIGRTEADGVVQFATITKNANHAGGAVCGHIKTPDGKLVHPNASCVGIELDAGGPLVRVGPNFVHHDTGRVVGPDDIYSDTRGRGWHKVTTYQRDTLLKLVNDLQSCLVPFPTGTTVVPTGDYRSNGVPWANYPGLYPKNCLGHVTLDPVQKTDPGPQVIGWLG